MNISRENQLILIGAYAANRRMKVDPDWFARDLQHIVEALAAKKQTHAAKIWLENRGIDANLGVVEGVRQAVENSAKSSDLFLRASKALASR